MTTDELLPLTLQVGVPREMDRLSMSGGPTATDWLHARTFADVLAEKGDNILYRSKKRGETARLMADLIRAIAILAFVPGGITCFGLHFEQKEKQLDD